MTMLPEYLPPPQIMNLKSGTDYSVEEEANALLAKGREGVTALCDKRDYLTHDQLILRSQKEVLNGNGVAEEMLSPGLFRRAYNPLAGHRPHGSKNYDDG